MNSKQKNMIVPIKLNIKWKTAARTLFVFAPIEAMIEVAQVPKFMPRTT